MRRARRARIAVLGFPDPPADLAQERSRSPHLKWVFSLSRKLAALAAAITRSWRPAKFRRRTRRRRCRSKKRSSTWRCALACPGTIAKSDRTRQLRIVGTCPSGPPPMMLANRARVSINFPTAWARLDFGVKRASFVSNPPLQLVSPPATCGEPASKPELPYPRAATCEAHGPESLS